MSGENRAMMLSIVTTMYQSEEYVEEFYRRIRAEAQNLTDNIEIIFVNDGTVDNSLTKAVALRQTDSQVRVIDLSRNFGHHKAMMTGLEYARGDLVFLIDIDLEEPPEILGPFYQALSRENADVAYGIQAPRHGPFLTRTLANLFYAIFEFLSDYSIPQHSLTARLTTSRYVSELTPFKEHFSNLSALW